jgi:hypothetical protein
MVSGAKCKEQSYAGIVTEKTEPLHIMEAMPEVAATPE